MINHLRIAGARVRGGDLLARNWIASAVILSFLFGVWWLHLRPGVFSFDSGFYLQEVVSGDVNNRKPFLYARFLQLTSLGGRAIHLSVLVQLCLIVLGLSRVFAIALSSGARLWAIILAAGVVANPYVANMAVYLQNDVLFCVAITVILAETVHMARSGVVNNFSSYLVLALFAPMALGFRENGLLFLPLWAVLTWFVFHRTTWVRSVISVGLTTIVAYASIIGVNWEEKHDLFYPAIIHETVRLAQPGFRYALGGRLSPETVAAVGADKLQTAVPLYWPLYWDSIAFFPDGPMLVDLEPARRKDVVHQFLKRDLLPNLPSIMAHRFEIFTGALLARAEAVDPYSVPSNLPADLASWKQHSADTARGHGLLGRINQISFDSRMWTWNAGLGLLALVLLTAISLWTRSIVGLVVASLLWIQAAVIFAVAPSAEYRYVFMIYLAPLLLMLFIRGRTTTPASSSTATQEL